MRCLKNTLILIVIITSLAGCERYALDRQMEELCKKDGGIKVYETVTLTPEEYDSVFNYVTTAKSQEERYGPAYRAVIKKEILVGKEADPSKGGGQLSRWYFAIYRKSDNALLGEAVSYDRSGGDFFTFGFQPSGNVCPHFDRGFEQSIFLKGE